MLIKKKDEFPIWVIILGAGASVDAGYPLYKEMTSPKDLEKRLSVFLKDEVKEDYDALNGLARRELESLIQHCSEISKSGMHLELYIKHLAENDPQKLDEVIRYYHNVLTIPEYHISRYSADYLRLFLQIPGLMAPVKTVVISFNHDLLVEHSNAWQFYYGGSDEMTYKSVTISPTTVTEPIQLGKSHFSNRTPFSLELIKLHGSLNWLRCENCGHIVYANVPVHSKGNDFSFVFNSAHNCPKCGKSRTWKTTLLPPIAQKEIDQLASFWKAAKAAMSKATYITVAGYSFPEYDLEAWELLDSIENCSVFEMIEPYPSNTVNKISSLIENKETWFVLQRTTMKERTRDLIYKEYGFDPFPNNSTKYKGPSLRPVWLW